MLSMHAFSLLAPTVPIEPLPVDPQQNICCITGMECACIPRKLGILESFTNQDMFYAPQSAWIGVDAYRVLRYRPERASSWYCNGSTFQKLTRQDVRKLILCGEYDHRWAGYATTSYKKHGGLWATVNTRPRAVWRFESIDVDCSDHGRVDRMWSSMLEWISAGIGRRMMETLKCPPYWISRIGAATWMAFERWAAPIHLSPLYLFLCYLLPSKEEMTNEL